jgi:hypothetical protein
MPLLAPMQRLLGRGVRRGAVVAIEGEVARSSLAMVLLAGLSAAGGWCGVVGVPSFGCLAAKGFGVRMDTLALVPRPGEAWAEAVSALVTGMDVVLVHPPAQVPGRLARRLAAKARQSRCTLLTLGSVWEGSDVRVSAVREQWSGLERGRGRLRRRRLTVVASHRPGIALDLWLPEWDGSVHGADVGASPPVSPSRERHAWAV